MRKIKADAEAPNVLDMVPAHSMDFEERDGRIMLLVPKFGDNRLGRFFMQRMKRPYYKIHLDEFGSRVWNLIDGRITVYQIGTLLHQEFGNDVEPVYERLGLFINMLAQRHFIHLKGQASD